MGTTANTTNITSLTMTAYITFSVFYFISALFAEWSIKSLILSFLACTLVIQFIMNLWATSMLCNIDSTKKIDTIKAIRYTVVPWVFILCLIAGILFVMPGWVRVFSNTIGAAVAKSIYSKVFELDKPVDKKDISGIVNEIYHDPSKLINEIGYVAKISEFEELYKKFLNKFEYFEHDAFKPDAKNKDYPPLHTHEGEDDDTINKSHMLYQLFRCVAIKEKVGYFIWLFLTGMIFVLVSLSQIYESDC
jgi:hypothetical protein